ncbi:MAG: tetratricopeptide repeat protein [Ignavibacteria bacterium]|nr:tetratricopeptide repeat protein [Ignavibacteria bacterium]
MTAEELNNIANELRKHGRFVEAQAAAEEALTTARTDDDKKQEARALTIAGLLATSVANFPGAEGYYHQAFDLYQEQGNTSALASVTGNIGYVHRALGNFDKSLEYYTQSLTAHEEIGDRSGAANCIMSIGTVYTSLGMYDIALEYFSQALSAHKEIGTRVDIANSTGNIGVIYRMLGNYSKALEYMEQTIAVFTELGSKSGIASVKGNIGLVYENLGNFAEALEYYGQALAANIELGDTSGIARMTANIGNAYLHQDDYSNALEYMGKALAAFTELGEKLSIAVTTGNIGVLYAKSEKQDYNPEKAEEMLFQSIALLEELHAKPHIYIYYKSLAALYEKQERWKEANEYNKKYHEVFEEIQSEEATKQSHLLEHRRKIEESERDRQIKLARFQEQEKILHNILPAQIADRMIDGEKTIADSYEHVSVFFSDIVGFTKLSQSVSAEELVSMLNGIFTQFDQLARKHGLEKIKTIGDAYMAVCGAPIKVDNHAERTALFALDVVELMNNYQTNSEDKVMIRIGLHSGSVVAGIIGENKFAYDMWGDAVNTASRMESHGEAGKIHVSEEFKQALQEGPGLSQESPMSLHFQERGEMDIKGKGMMKTYFLEKA